MKIIVAEKISASAMAQLQEPGWSVLTADQLDGKLAEHLESADALIVRSAVQADAKLLAHAKKLRVIGRAGVGVDNIDLEAATHKGIAVMNTPGANAVAVAEQTLGIMLAMAYVATRTLWFPIGIHFGWNFTEDYLFGVRISGHAAQPAVFNGTLLGTPMFTGGEYGIEAALPSVLLGGVLAAIFIWLAYRNQQIVSFPGT